MVLAIWARNTLGLNTQEYEGKVQVYKRLDTIWRNEYIQSKHPDAGYGAFWDQTNTLLIDDSVAKAASEPYNHVEIPEFVKPF